MSESRLVYSTESGRIKTPEETTVNKTGDGIVRIYRQTKGRKGSGVSVIEGIDKDTQTLKDIAKTLKKSLGVGGSVKEQTIEIQTDNREKIKSLLEKTGFEVKIAGG